MNKDQLLGTAFEFGGEFQATLGKILGSKRQQVRGLQRQISGRAKKNLGTARELIKNAVKQSDNGQ